MHEFVEEKVSQRSGALAAPSFGRDFMLSKTGMREVWAMW